MAHALLEVNMLAGVLEEKMGDKIKLYPLADVVQIEARCGKTIDIVKNAYIGDAVKVNAGADIPATDFTQTKDTATVGKIGKRLQFNIEDILNNMIDLNAECEKQLLKSLSNKIEADMFAELDNATLEAEVDAYDVGELANIVAVFEEDIDEEMYLFVNPAQLAELRQDPTFVVNASHGNAIIGSAGMVYGMEIVVSNRVTAGEAFVVKKGGLKLFMKKGVEIEVDKNIVNQKIDIVGTVHYAVKLVDDTKVIKVAIAEAEAGA